MRKTASVGFVIFFMCGAARAQDDGCKPMPTLMPARDTASDLRCFPQRIAPRGQSRTSG